jgi:hypothetical protein
LDIPLIKELLKVDVFASVIAQFLWGLVQGEVNDILFTTILTAIPKEQRSTADPAQLRPISVTSVWYRIIARLFTLRLNKLVPDIYS